MPDETPIVQLEGVRKVFDGATDGQAVLTGVTMSVRPGEAVSVVGPSGCGKSTLLNIIGALDRPSAGRVLFDGTDLATLDDASLADLRNRSIGFVFQAHHLLPQCTVLENVLVPTLVRRRAERKGAEQRARTLLDRVGLADRMDHRPGELSGGEKQRVAVVRALINEPRLLLADEPTGSLDRAASENLTELLLDINREQGVTVVVVTHNLSLAGRMGRTLELVDGEVTEKRIAGTAEGG